MKEKEILQKYITLLSFRSMIEKIEWIEEDECYLYLFENIKQHLYIFQSRDRRARPQKYKTMWEIENYQVYVI